MFHTFKRVWKCMHSFPLTESFCKGLIVCVLFWQRTEYSCSLSVWFTSRLFLSLYFHLCPYWFHCVSFPMCIYAILSSLPREQVFARLCSVVFRGWRIITGLPFCLILACLFVWILMDFCYWPLCTWHWYCLCPSALSARSMSLFTGLKHSFYRQSL